jgi:hypothetical protein
VLLTPEVVNSTGIQDLLHHTRKAREDSVVLLCWRGSIPREAFEIIDEDGNVLQSGLAPDSDVGLAACSQKPSPAATVAAVPEATPARLPAGFPEAASSQQLAQTNPPADVPSVVSSNQFAKVAPPSCAGRPHPVIAAPDQAANLPPQLVSHPQAQPPSEPQVVLGQERHAEMEQGAEMEQRAQQDARAARRLHMVEQQIELAEEAAMSRRDQLQWAQAWQTSQVRQEMVEMDLQEAQAKLEQLELHAEQEVVARAQHEEVASERHEESVRQLAAREREEQQAQQKEEEAARMLQAGEKRKQNRVMAERRHQSAEERQGRAASSQEGREGHAASSQSPPAVRRRGVPTCSDELKAWLIRHNLTGVHDCDQHGWSALHHVAWESKSEVAGEHIFEELCNHGWSPEQLDRVTGAAPCEKHLPHGWTALHLLANGRGMHRAPMVRRRLELKANPIPLTDRGATPLHTAAGTGNHDVAQLLLRTPGVNVNAKNKNNKTPYDMAVSNKSMRQLIQAAGGFSSPDATGKTGKDEPNTRARAGEASQARRKRAADWRAGLT